MLLDNTLVAVHVTGNRFVCLLFDPFIIYIVVLHNSVFNTLLR